MIGTAVANQLGRKGEGASSWPACLGSHRPGQRGLPVDQASTSVVSPPYALICIVQFGNAAAFAFCYLHSTPLHSSEYFPTHSLQGRGVWDLQLHRPGWRSAGWLLSSALSSSLTRYFIFVFALIAALMFSLTLFLYGTRDQPVCDSIRQPLIKE